jgi:hypothetical protein
MAGRGAGQARHQAPRIALHAGDQLLAPAPSPGLVEREGALPLYAKGQSKHAQQQRGQVPLLHEQVREPVG